MKQFIIIKSGGDNTFTPGISDDIHNEALVANVAKDVTAPAGAKYVVFSTTVNFYVKWNGTGAAVLDADVELNPSQKALEGATQFSIVSADAGNVCYQFYG